MDKILAFMGKSMKEGDTSDAAECLLQYLYENFDEGFKRIAEKNGIVILKDKKMDASRVEAMLHELHGNKTDLQTLFQHIKQFFGYSFFESEQKCRVCFVGKEFPPESDVYVLPD